MKKSAKAIISELQGADKERALFYLDKALQERFKEVCMQKKVRMSSVVERLIEGFLAEVAEKSSKD